VKNDHHQEQKKIYIKVTRRMEEVAVQLLLIFFCADWLGMP
jgi:hypothetical protein